MEGDQSNLSATLQEAKALLREAGDFNEKNEQSRRKEGRPDQEDVLDGDSSSSCASTTSSLSPEALEAIVMSIGSGAENGSGLRSDDIIRSIDLASASSSSERDKINLNGKALQPPDVAEKPVSQMTKEELAEALEAERMITRVLRSEIAELRELVSALVAEKDNKTSSGQSSTAVVTSSSSPSSTFPPSSTSTENNRTEKKKTMADLFGGSKTKSSRAAHCGASEPSHPSQEQPAGGVNHNATASHHAASDHEKRKEEILKMLAKDDELTANGVGVEDPFVAEARRKHIVIDDRFAGISAVGFGNRPNPRGYLGGGGGGGLSSVGTRGPTSSMEGDPSEVREVMRKALEEGIMDDRRAVLEADEEAKLEARLKRLQSRK